MGRTAVVTFEMVASAAEAMKAEKLDVVTRAVRERLGNVGSMGTINNHLQAWKSRQEQHVTSALTLPPALQKSILDFMGVELSNARSTLESALAAQQKEMADLANDNEKQYAEIEASIETTETLRNEIATLHGKSSQLEINLVTSKDDLVRERENAEFARTELAKALLRLEAMPRLEADLNAARAALDAERTSKVAAEQSAAVAIAKLEYANQRVQELHERLNKSEAINLKALDKIDSIKNTETKQIENNEPRKPGRPKKPNHAPESAPDSDTDLQTMPLLQE
jgi:chromosome segregation ATPase